MCGWELARVGWGYSLDYYLWIIGGMVMGGNMIGGIGMRGNMMDGMGMGVSSFYFLDCKS